MKLLFLICILFLALSCSTQKVDEELVVEDEVSDTVLNATVLVGDFLFINGLSYGKRVEITPLNFGIYKDSVHLVFLSDTAYDSYSSFIKRKVAGPGEVIKIDSTRK